jgi:hypothetical protein
MDKHLTNTFTRESFIGLQGHKVLQVSIAQDTADNFAMVPT